MGRQELIGLAVFKPEDWSRLLDEADDAGELEATWEEWERTLRATEDQLDGLGVKYREVPVNLDALGEYCRRERIPNTAETRAAFAAERIWKKKRA